MRGLYDSRPIYTVEEYLSYGFEHIEDMTKQELKQEISRVKKDIKELVDEYEDCRKDGSPYHAITEEISSLKIFLEKLEAELADREKNEKKKKG